MISVTPSLSAITPFKYKQRLPSSSSFPSKVIRKLEVTCPVPADIDIANSVEPLPISQIAEDLNLSSKHYDLYGKYKAKAITSVLEEVEGDENGYYVMVGGITPTPLGEGKSISTVGLCQALGAFLDKKIKYKKLIHGIAKFQLQPQILIKHLIYGLVRLHLPLKIE